MNKECRHVGIIKEVMIPLVFQYPSYTVYRHTAAPVLALLCKLMYQLSIEASERT